MPSASTEQLRICYLNLPHMKNEPDTVDKIHILQYYERVGPYLWPIKLGVAILSALVSLLNVVVFTRKPMRRSSLNLLLIALEVANILLCVFQIIYSSVEIIQGDYAATTHIALMKFMCFRFTSLAAVFINWVAAIISFWRYLAIKQPLKVKYRLTRKRAVLIVFFTLLVTLSPHFLAFITLELTKKTISICSTIEGENPVNFTYYFMSLSSWGRSNLDFVTYFQRGLVIFNYLLPILLIFVMTICLLTTICSYKERRDCMREGQSQVYIEEKETRTTVILIVLLVFYVLSNSVEVVISQLHQTEFYSKDANILKASFILQGSLMTQVTNVFSFFAYYFMGTNFRGTLHEMFLRKKK